MIQVNGNSMDWRDGLTVSEILVRRNYDSSMVVVSIDDELVPRSEFDCSTVPDGAVVKVIQLADGG